MGYSKHFICLTKWEVENLKLVAKVDAYVSTYFPPQSDELQHQKAALQKVTYTN